MAVRASIPSSIRLAATMPAALLGGMVAATIDVIAARPQLPRFLFDGTTALWLFLATLYGAALAVALLLLTLLAIGLSRFTLLGRLWASSPEPARVATWGLLASGLLSLGLFSAAVYPVTLGTLGRFHHPGLIAVVVAVAAGGLLLSAAAVGLFVLSRLPTPPEGRGITLRFAGPRSLYALGFTLGLLGLCAALFARIFGLQKTLGLTMPMRALQLSLWAPFLALGALAIGHGIGRTLARRVKRFEANRGLDSRAALLLLPVLALLIAALPLAVAFAEPLRILDFRPLRTAGLGLFAALLILGPLWQLSTRSSFRFAFVLPIALYIAALSLGRAERVRKAALGLAPLSEQIVLMLANVADLDGDGVAGRWAIGGSDCDDFDATRHPGAFDWPDNGIDENCNGHDATATPPHAKAAAAPVPAGLVKKPNIVLITIDALRADHVSAYGYGRRTTPAIDRLAAEPDGVLCETAWAHAPSTRYSVPAILTGRYPSTVAWGPPQVHWPPEVLPENRLLSEMLGDRGYSTTALLTYHYFERSWGLAQGFDDYDTHLMTLHSLGGDPAATSGSSARELADLALDRLSRLTAATNDKPFFLWLHFYDPHYRYEPHTPPPGESSYGISEVDLYDGEIRYTDQHIGRVLDFLRTSPAWPRTAVLITSDHGEGFGEHGIAPDHRHGYHLYADQTRVPMILRLPGLSGPRRIATPVGHVDLAPTLVQLSTGEEPSQKEPQLLGRSMLPLLADPGSGRDDVVFQEVMYEGPTVRKAIVDGRWHLIQNLIPDGTTELYDLKNDPAEDRDRFGREPGIEAQLSQRLSAWLDDSAVPPNFAQRVAGNLSPTPIAATSPVGAQIGDFLDVVGSDGPKAPIGRGQAATVTVVYRVRQRIATGYRLFVHLRGQSGRSLNLDHDFIEGLVPPQQLRPGMYVRDVVRMTIPPWFPSGPAKLLVGLFRRDTRAPVSGPSAVVLREDRAVQAATLEIR